MNLEQIQQLEEKNLNTMQRNILRGIKHNYERNNISKADKEMFIFIKGQY